MIMADQPSHSHLEQAISAAQKEIHTQRREAEAQQTARSVAAWRKSVLPRYLLLGLVVIFGVIAYEDSAIAAADLQAIAAFVETYRISQGHYPDSLNEVNLPGGWAALIRQMNVQYRKTDKAFVLNWTLPRWRLEYDGQTGTAKIDPTTRR
jgi:hypothetical protein